MSWGLFVMVFVGMAVGNGLGAWNIRTIASGRYAMTAVLTFLAYAVQGTVSRFNAQHEWAYVVAGAAGSVIGILGGIWLDKRWERQP